MVIEEVEIPDNSPQVEMIKLLETRENYWHAALMSKRIFGGLNKR